MTAGNTTPDPTPTANLAIAGPDVPEVYCNARFSFCLEYPGFEIHPVNNPANGDGISLADTKEAVRVHAYGYNRAGNAIENEFDASLEMIMNSNPEAEIEFAIQKKKMFEIRFRNANSIVYHKVKMSDDNFYGISIYIDRHEIAEPYQILKRIQKKTKIYKY